MQKRLFAFGLATLFSLVAPTYSQLYPESTVYPAQWNASPSQVALLSDIRVYLDSKEQGWSKVDQHGNPVADPNTGTNPSYRLYWNNPTTGGEQIPDAE